MENNPVSVQVSTESTPSDSRQKYSYGKKNWLKWILIYLVIGGLIYAGLYYFIFAKQSSNPYSSAYPAPSTAKVTSTSEPASTDSARANWKTYSNGVYSFQYPETANWHLSEQPGPLGKWVSVLCSNCNGQVDYFQVVPTTVKSLDDYIKNPVGTSDFTQIKLDGAAAVKAAYAGGAQAGGSSIKVFFLYKGIGYEIDMRFSSLLNIDTLSKFPKPNPDILSTFKFIK